LRALAQAALRHWPVAPERVRLLLHGFNTTYRVDTVDRRRFALRLSTMSPRTAANMAAEVAWLRALAAETPLTVPEPQPTLTGALVARVDSEALGRAVPAVLFSWLPGPDLGAGDATVEQMRTVGRAVATLHAHAETWTPPPGAELAPLGGVLMNSPDHLAVDHELLTAPVRAVLDAARAEAERHLSALFAGATLQALHADLHNDNLKWCRGRLAVFDFDDCGYGVPAQDLGIAAYYLRDESQLEAALLEGYQELRPLPLFTPAQYEAVVAARNLVLLNDVLGATTAELRAVVPRYVPNSVVKLRHWLETGRYRHEVPGLI
jgi:Ser/Thr protein kinase RdoA (MazF antagonist)